MIRARILGLIAVLIWGTHAASARFILSTGASPWAMAGVRLWIAFVFMVALGALIFGLPVRSDLVLWRKNTRAFWLAWAFGFLPNILFFHLALKWGFAGSTMILENTSPAFALALGVLFFKQPIKRSALWSVGLATFGIGLIFKKEYSGGLFAPLMGLMAGLTWAVFARWSEAYFATYGKPDDPAKFTEATSGAQRFWILAQMMGFGALALTPAVIAAPVMLSPAQWQVLVYYAIAPTAIAYLIWNEVIEKISAVSASVFFCLTIPTTLVFANLTLGEPLTPTHVLAALSVILAVIWDGYSNRQA